MHSLNNFEVNDPQLSLTPLLRGLSLELRGVKMGEKAAEEPGTLVQLRPF